MFTASSVFSILNIYAKIMLIQLLRNVDLQKISLYSYIIGAQSKFLCIDDIYSLCLAILVCTNNKI